MKRIDATTVELTSEEVIVAEIVGLLLDAGYSHQQAVDLVFGCEVSHYLRSHTPMLDTVMTADFVAYLRGTE